MPVVYKCAKLWLLYVFIVKIQLRLCNREILRTGEILRQRLGKDALARPHKEKD